MAGGVASGSGLFKFIKNRPHPIDIQAAAGWGIVAFTGAVWVVQPFDWVRKTFFEKPEPEK